MRVYVIFAAAGHGSQSRHFSLVIEEGRHSRAERDGVVGIALDGARLERTARLVVRVGIGVRARVLCRVQESASVLSCKVEDKRDALK